jgi:copper homeostasis protein
MIIEICANGFESAQIAQDAGADRIELCTNLSVGGLTPSRELIEKVISELNIPTHILIRPRSGDFCYSKVEFETMLADIAFCNEIGCAGVVSGLLTAEKGIDMDRTKQLIEASEGMEFTFHRAIDVCNSIPNAIQMLLTNGATRLLSSGQQPTALFGIKTLNSMNNLAKGKLQIMPGGGINSQNALAFKEAGFEAIHLSAIKKELGSTTSTDLFNTQVSGHSDRKEIETIIQLLK